MNSGDIKFKVRRCAFIGKFSVSVLSLLLVLLPQAALAKSSDLLFQQYLYDACYNIFPYPSSWDGNALDSACAAAFPGGNVTPGSNTFSTNISSANSASALTTRKKKRIPLDEQKDKGASADGSGWGLLVSPQYSMSNRTDTDLENGYQSDLAGLVVGLDYRFSDRFVLGGVVGQTKDKAVYVNNAGSLKTSNNTITMYSTWLPTDAVSVDGYLGYGKLNLDNQRNVDYALIHGVINGSTTGKQILAGLSTTYQMDAGRFNVAPFFNLDYVKTSFKGYDETGSTVLVPQGGGFPPLNYGTSTIAMRFFDRSTTSFTSSLGARVSTTYGYDWGTIAPSFRLATVHEFQNKAQQISNELVITPGYGMSVATDAPDSNYLNIGLGVSAALNGGTLLFLDYDKRIQDKLLSSWAVSLGVLTEF